MKYSIAFALAGLALVSGAAAQNNLGTFTNCGTTFTTRGGSAASNTNTAVLFTRIDKEHYAGWTNGAAPFTREIVGINFVIQDQNLATQHNFNLIVYGEDPAMANFPAVATPASTSGNLVLPVGTGAGAWNASGNFATPVSMPSTGDVFVAVRINSPWTISGGQVTDGLSVWELRDTSPTSPQAGQAWDVAGARLPQASPDNSFSGYYVPSPQAGPAYPLRTMMKLQPIIPISGGVAGAVTNQVNHPESNTGTAASFTVQAPGAGTASMYSALHPDAANPPFTAGRADDLSQMFENAALALGSPVFFLIDIGTFGPEIPATNFIPGSTGVACLNLSTMQNLGFVSLATVGTTQRAHRVTVFPAAVRPLLTGIDWLQQAVALDIGTNTLHASTCTLQKT